MFVLLISQAHAVIPSPEKSYLALQGDLGFLAASSQATPLSAHIFEWDLYTQGSSVFSELSLLWVSSSWVSIWVKFSTHKVLNKS